MKDKLVPAFFHSERDDIVNSLNYEHYVVGYGLPLS